MGTSRFNQEYLLIPIVREEAKFKREWIQYFNPDDIDGFDYIISALDPSTKKEEQHCYKALVTAGIKDGIVDDVTH